MNITMSKLNDWFGFVGGIILAAFAFGHGDVLGLMPLCAAAFFASELFGVSRFFFFLFLLAMFLGAFVTPALFVGVFMVLMTYMACVYVEGSIPSKRS